MFKGIITQLRKSRLSPPAKIVSTSRFIPLIPAQFPTTHNGKSFHNGGKTKFTSHPKLGYLIGTAGLATTMFLGNIALAEEQSEIPHTETVLHKNPHFLAEREGNYLKFYVKGHQTEDCVLAFRIYGHDNRLESIAINFDKLSIDEANNFAIFLKKVLNEKICGKAFIFDADETTKPIFKAAGFSFEPADAEKTSRVATIRANILATIPTSSLPKGFEFRTNIDPTEHAERLMELAEKSVFLPEKIKDYMAKGMSGLLAMQQESVTRPTIFDENGRVVACCTVSCPINGPAYIADTWVDENAFGSKAVGTALLYQQIGGILPSTKVINLIMPPGRVQEFKDYGFTTPRDSIGVAFQAPGLYLGRAFEWQKIQAAGQSVKTNRLYVSETPRPRQP